MKKQLLLLIVLMLSFTTALEAQIKVWDLAGEQLGAGYTNMLTTNDLNDIFHNGITYGNSGLSMAAGTFVINSSEPGISYVTTSANQDRIRTNNTTQTRYDESAVPGPAAEAPYTNGTTNYVGGIYANGTGNHGRRHLLLDLVSGDKITVIMSLQSTGGATEGTFTVRDPLDVDVVYGPYDTTPDYYGAYAIHIEAATTGAYKLYTTENKAKFYRVYDDYVTMTGIPDINGEALSVKNMSHVTTDLHAAGDRVYVSNVKSNTEIKIYSITGVLVKAFKTNIDTDFSFKSGLYIATVKTFEGQKSIKLLLN
ncbi:T9SS type A sorting domain-containing protein [Pseudalgibacter alginicilyticus]|nr:T9SS type A sorting domain-containing protein [Pseudalgibacter alginicilyticus]